MSLYSICNICRQRSITDRMIKMMEQYTDNLEDLVAERSEQLAIEKEKADNLLCRMLPKLVSFFGCPI